MSSIAQPTIFRVAQSITVDTFLTTIDSFYGDRWRNFGIMWAYIVFNVFAALFLYWLMRVPKGWSLGSYVAKVRGGAKAGKTSA